MARNINISICIQFDCASYIGVIRWTIVARNSKLIAS